MLIVHEVMGRHCGWLTAAAAAEYRRWLDDAGVGCPSIGLSTERWDVHAVFLPELALDIDAEAERLRGGHGRDRQRQHLPVRGRGHARDRRRSSRRPARGARATRSATCKLDTINPGQWFAKQFAEKLGAEKVMVQKSGYFSRAAAGQRARTCALIKSMTDLAVECALRGESGVIGHDEEDGDRLKAIAFPRIAGGKAFDVSQPWFGELLAGIGQRARARRRRS